MSTETQAGRHGSGFTLYVAIAALLMGFSIVSGFSVGFFILPIPVAMFVSIAWWSRPWIVAGILCGAIAFSVAFLGTAPIRCGISSVKEPGRPAATREWCTRLFLPDIEGRSSSRPSDTALSFGIAAAAGAIAGTTGAKLGRSLIRRARPAI
jgi:hypothetical protein